MDQGKVGLAAAAGFNAEMAYLWSGAATDLPYSDRE